MLVLLVFLVNFLLDGLELCFFVEFFVLHGIVGLVIAVEFLLLLIGGFTLLQVFLELFGGKRRVGLRQLLKLILKDLDVRILANHSLSWLASLGVDISILFKLFLLGDVGGLPFLLESHFLLVVIVFVDQFVHVVIFGLVSDAGLLEESLVGILFELHEGLVLFSAGHFVVYVELGEVGFDDGLQFVGDIEPIPVALHYCLLELLELLRLQLLHVTCCLGVNLTQAFDLFEGLLELAARAASSGRLC